MLQSFLRNMGNANMVEKGAALAGRAETMAVAEKHFVHKQSNMRGPWPEPLKVAVFATGCFWGTEKGFWRLPGVHATATGYCGGFTPNPTYDEACSGKTGHTEAVQVTYDSEVIAYTDLLRLFWQSHDPTQGMGQGNDRGTQYRSGVYPTDDEQHALAAASKAAYEKALGREITTEMADAGVTTFYYAEDYHQQYLAKPGARQYCSAQPTGVDLPPYKDWKPDGDAFDEAGAHRPRLEPAFWAKHGPKPMCTIGVPNEPIVWPEPSM